jgi:hypothetical protein
VPRPPAWSDLIGVNGAELRPPGRSPSPPSIGEPLPQRRPPDRADDRGEPGDEPAPPPAEDRVIPRQQGPVDAGPVPSPDTATTAATAAPTPLPAPSAPPAWPPVPDADGSGVEPTADAPPVPESLTKALDMTAEIPRVRVEWESDEGEYADGVDGDQGRRFADQTMELPIFRELESAWFRTRQSARPDTPAAAPAGDGQGGGAAEAEAPVEPMRASAGAPLTSVPEAGAEPEGAAEPDVASAADGWHTAADEGWRAASVLAQEQEFTTTATGLPQRVPMSQLVPGGVETATGSVQRRSPEAVRGLLSAYHRGVQRGRTNKSADPKTPEHTTAGPQNNSQAGKEQEG